MSSKRSFSRSSIMSFITFDELLRQAIPGREETSSDHHLSSSGASLLQYRQKVSCCLRTPRPRQSGRSHDTTFLDVLMHIGAQPYVLFQNPLSLLALHLGINWLLIHLGELKIVFPIQVFKPPFRHLSQRLQTGAQRSPIFQALWIQDFLVGQNCLARQAKPFEAQAYLMNSGHRHSELDYTWPATGR